MQNDLRSKNFSACVAHIRALPPKRKLDGLLVCFMTDSQNDDRWFLTDQEALGILEAVKDLIPGLVGDWGQPDTLLWITCMEAGHFRCATRLMELGYPMTNLLDPRQDYAEAWLKALALHVYPLSGLANPEAETFCAEMLQNAPQLGPMFMQISRWMKQMMETRYTNTMTWRLDHKVSAETRQGRQHREYPFFLRSCSIAQLNSYMMP